MQSKVIGTFLTLPIFFFLGAQCHAASSDAAFEKQFGPAFFDAYWSLHPEFAIGVGYYKYADRVIVPDERARNAELAFAERWLARLHKIDPAKLGEANRADWAILENEFQSRRWEIQEDRAWEWNPAVYNVAEPVAKILTTPFQPLEQRLQAIARRLQQVPAYYAAARRNIKNPTREHTLLAIEQNEGALSVFDSVRSTGSQSSLSTSDRARLTGNLQVATKAVQDYVAWLREVDAQSAKSSARSFRIGRDRYEKKFAFNIQTGVTAEVLFAQAQREKERLLQRMEVLADQLWAKYFPNVAAPADRLDRIGRLIAKLSEQHATPEDFLGAVERQIPELAKWVTDHGLLSLDADKPLKVRETPQHQRGVAMAGIDSPGPYDALAPTYYNVMPLKDLPRERAESLLREYNRWMLPILNIHEAIPGHYAQLVYANKSPSRIKAIFGNGAMVEGWAVYGERAMLESGYGDHVAEFWLIYSKWLLRSVCNTILDYSVHVLDMSEADAKQLLVRDAFQSAEEADGKWRRVRLTSVQLASYFAGYSAIYDLREQQKRDLGTAFDLKKFHEKFLSFGSAPVSVIAKLMQVTK